jgi:serine/threonine-protein kinase
VALKRLGPYEVAGLIGNGGMGAVFLARGPTGEVAIKLLTSSKPAAAERFDRERRLQARLGGLEGFVPLLDMGRSESGPFLVMPLLRGGTLRDRLERGGLGLDASVALGVRLARAMGRAHALGVVHRDLKPENVLFDEAGNPLIADLGLAKHFSSAAPGASQSVSLSVDGSFRGTAGYMAPEQARDAKSVGPPADVFSLGAILYECVSGAPAFTGRSPLELLTKLEEGRVEPLQGPAWLVAVVERALAREPGARFADADELARALERGEVAAPAKRSGPGRRALVIVVVVTLALGALFVARARGRADRLVADGSRLLDRDDFRGAIAAFTDAIALEPSSAAPWTERAWARCLEGSLHGRASAGTEGLADAERAVALDPASTRALCSLAFAHACLGDNQRVMEDVEKALARDPRCVRALVWRAFLLHVDSYKDASVRSRSRKVLDEALALEPDGADTWLIHANMSDLAREAGDDETATKEARRALELGPGHLIPCTSLALALLLRHPDEAVPVTMRSIERDPLYGEAWRDRFTARWKMGQLDLEIADCDRWLTHDPRSLQAFLNRGYAKLRTGDLPGAKADLDAAADLSMDGTDSPAVATALDELAAVLKAKGDEPGATRAAERARELRR